MKIKSITDVITNSSSEVFTIKSPEGRGKEDVLKELLEYHKSKTIPWEEKDQISEESQEKFDIGCSGEGGILEVKNFNDRYEENKNYIPKSKQHLYTPEIYSLIDYLPYEVQKNSLKIWVDDAFRATIKYVFENFEIIEADGNYHTIWDDAGEKIIGYTTWEEWTKLDPIRKYGKLYCENYDWVWKD